ncbi:MAG: PDZ domain-containing protein [Planctomycetes bacterium]|nr:PDZ domain-containing protein [Planctomycetota bacterium]
MSGDGQWLLTSEGGGWSIRNASGQDAKGLNIGGVTVRVEPAEEWPQILREAWRIERDYFYDPNMHHVDWPAIWRRWSAFLPHVKHRADLNVLVSEMIGELCCGHEYCGGGEMPGPPGGVSVGLLGCDYEVDRQRYRITRIYRGQNWNPGLRAPLTGPGVDARAGDYLITVNGRPVMADENIFRAFENTAGRQVEITLASKPDGNDARTMTVVPIGDEFGLRHLSWIESNRQRVSELSGGRLAYIYMPDTAGGGMAAFDRDFFSQLGKQGVILDERYNGGGQAADYVIDILSRNVISYWMNRERWVGQTPFGTIEGPKVMIINESAGSGGDWMPWAFQKEGVGPLVGTRTWGGLVGISGYPALMDGGFVTAANFGVMDENGEWAVENIGVAPDYEVIEWPKEVIAGRDPQLEKAVELALAALERDPPRPRPEYKEPVAR